MKQTSIVGTLLTLLMFLLVLVAAVVFLASRKQALETDLQSERQAVTDLNATREQLESDLAVRQAAFEAADATRAALATSVEDLDGQIAELGSQLSQQQTMLDQALSDLQQKAVQVFIFSPKEGAIIPPDQAVEVLVAARAEAELDSVALSVDDNPPVRYPAVGMHTFTAKIEWKPPDEGSYLIQAVARDADGLESEPATVTVQAAFATDATREEALRTEAATLISDLRFPQPAAGPQLSAAEASPPDLHQLLLTGRAVYTGSVVFSDTLVLRAFDFAPSDFELASYAAAVLDPALLTYYDPDLGQTRVYSTTGASGAFGRWAQLHPATHQIQEERLGLNPTAVPELDADARMALRALCEGEANFLQSLVLIDDNQDAADSQALMEGLAAAEVTGPVDTPSYLDSYNAFAYEAGYSFVHYLYDQGGYGQLDAAWQQRPRSSEQILHPERFLAGDDPQPVSLQPPDALLRNDWRMAGDDTFGEFQLRQLLQQELDAAQVNLAASGWGGGRYAVYWQEESDDLLAMLALAWDSPADGDEFAEAFQDYAAQRLNRSGQTQADGSLCWSAEEVFCLYHGSQSDLVIRAPDLATAASAALSQPILAEP